MPPSYRWAYSRPDEGEGRNSEHLHLLVTGPDDFYNGMSDTGEQGVPVSLCGIVCNESGRWSAWNRYVDAVHLMRFKQYGFAGGNCQDCVRLAGDYA